MKGTIINCTTANLGGGWIRVNITVMPHPENGVPMEDLHAGFYVRNKADIPLEEDDIDIFKHHIDHQYYVAFESKWYESMFI